LTADRAFIAALDAALRHLGVPCDPAQGERLAGHFALLLEANRQVNLTRVTEAVDAAVRLYADSAAAVAWVAQAGVTVRTVLDVGSGAGFPALPLAVLRPEWQVTALEATGKKAAFIERCAESLGIPNLRAVHAHADHWREGGRFDLVIFKAVGSLADCLAWGAPRVSSGGHLLMHKTISLPAEEVLAARRVASRLGLESLSPFVYALRSARETARFALHACARP